MPTVAQTATPAPTSPTCVASIPKIAALINGAVHNTAFGANLRGYTVVVAEDGIASDSDFAVLLTKWQLRNQPGLTNPDNTPLTATAVTISSFDKITFKWEIRCRIVGDPAP